MTEEQKFALDIIRIIPIGSVIRIQAPSLDDPEFLKLFSNQASYYRQIKLSNDNKDAILSLIQKKFIVDSFHSVEVTFDDELLFEGHDGMEVGSLSRHLEISEELKMKYRDKLFISTDW